MKTRVPLAALVCALALAHGITDGKAAAPPQLRRKGAPPQLGRKGVPPRDARGRGNTKKSPERDQPPKHRLLAQIKRDTGREITPSSFLSSHSYATRRSDKQPLLVVLSKAGTPCGDDAYVFVYDKPRGKYLELLGLRCVKDVHPSPEAKFTNGHPDLLYNSQPPSAGWSYTAVLRFDGKFYAEHDCGTAEQRGADIQITTGCDGRGLLSLQKQSEGNVIPRD
ncbi:MAG TPA: hypothetical protein VGB98_09735 [Pyrinomonadaceae bacterium]